MAYSGRGEDYFLDDSANLPPPDIIAAEIVEAVENTTESCRQ